MRKSKAKDPATARVDSALKAIYADGFNIYAAINKLKKKLTSVDKFPDEVLLGVCESYWRSKPGIKNRWPWFVAAMEYQTRLWICDQNQKAKPDPRAGFSQSIKEILGNG